MEELKDLVSSALETRDVLPRLRAQLRAEVYRVLADEAFPEDSKDEV
jgi:hypothetical protein